MLQLHFSCSFSVDQQFDPSAFLIYDIYMTPAILGLWDRVCLCLEKSMKRGLALLLEKI